jgi:hypothetical protein
VQAATNETDLQESIDLIDRLYGDVKKAEAALKSARADEKESMQLDLKHARLKYDLQHGALKSVVSKGSANGESPPHSLSI